MKKIAISITVAILTVILSGCCCGTCGDKKAGCGGKKTETCGCAGAKCKAAETQPAK